jgi:protein ImuA
VNEALATVLARPDVWRGGALGAVPPAPTLPSGFAELDAEMPGGGWPRGQLTELLPEGEGIGELSLLLPALAALTADAGQAGTVFLIAPPHRDHAPAWLRAGIDPRRLRRVRAGNSRDAVWAAVQVLRCRAVGASLLWLEDGALLPASTVRRLHLAAGEGGGAAFLFRPACAAAAASPAPLRLQLAAAGPRLAARLLKRRGVPLARSIVLDVSRPLPPTRFREAGHAMAGPGSVSRVPDAAVA